MGKILVKTGYGYAKDKNGNIVTRMKLPKGEHPFDQKNFTYHEVGSKVELDEIKVDKIESKEDKKRKLISNKISSILQKQAIEELKNEGILDNNGDLKE